MENIFIELRSFRKPTEAEKKQRAELMKTLRNEKAVHKRAIESIKFNFNKLSIDEQIELTGHLIGQIRSWVE